MMRFIRLIGLVQMAVCFVFSANGQKKQEITLEDIWRKGTFSAKFAGQLNWMSSGEFYSDVQNTGSGSSIIRFRTRTGQVVDTILNGNKIKTPTGGDLSIDDYSFSTDQQKILIQYGRTPIYRHSYLANYWVYDVKNQSLKAISPGEPCSYVTFSGDGNKVAYVKGNNLFYTDLTTGKEVSITSDGKSNYIINGACDWVYEEEFGQAPAFAWSPDSKKLAWLRFDEQEVPEYEMQMWGKLYPNDYTFKYPKAGETNATVTAWVYILDAAKKDELPVGGNPNLYIPRIGWTKDANTVSLRRLNRLQNRLELIHCDVNTRKPKTIIAEENSTYVELYDDLKYLDNGTQLVWTSEKDGFKHIYLYNIDGKLVNQITKGAWEVDQLLGVNEKAGLVYFTSSETGSSQRQLYSASIKDGKKVQLTAGAGTHEIEMAPDQAFYVDRHSSATTPYVITIYDAKGKVVKVLEENAALKKKLENYAIQPVEFFQFKSDEGVELKGWQIKPKDFDPNNKYPVLMYVYGGPGHQLVVDKWAGSNLLWYQLLAQKGYMIVCVDGRGTGGRGADFKKSTYAQLGKLETKDQMATARYLGTLGYVDKSRIGIWGWSFGGYMTSLCMTLGADLFKMGIAVAPVTNWRYYDSIYTERFLKTPQDNAIGYDENSPVTHASKLKGKFLLVHGTGDDNVHFQNAVALQDALISSNKQFTSFYYPNRNHGIYGGVTRLHLYTMMTDYIIKNL